MTTTTAIAPYIRDDVQQVMHDSVAGLITAITTNAELDAYSIAAEAGNGGPLFGLREAMGQLRDARARDTFTR
ncbi:hypothetical protein A5768_22195 [Mycolicibacterium fortuitum]|uniref:hypothetical protein n=1 Tax=Mycolicibacterium fortuitum TaxID=1766 RepID=UPI0007EB38AB|nr:hypothetical protein [Mycolicibacterium fortuitum]OBG24086.1 hypothetical protein A5768_22195 [Mycolicibacterium fortuitum]